MVARSWATLHNSPDCVCCLGGGKPRSYYTRSLEANSFVYSRGDPRGRPGTLRLIALTAVLVFTLLMSSGVTYAGGKAYVRVNQVGYITGETKWAMLMATGSEGGASFSVVNAANGERVYSAPLGAGQGRWSNDYPHTYLLDFSAVQTSGTYTLQVHGPITATSPTFKKRSIHS